MDHHTLRKESFLGAVNAQNLFYFGYQDGRELALGNLGALSGGSEKLKLLYLCLWALNVSRSFRVYEVQLRR